MSPEFGLAGISLLAMRARVKLSFPGIVGPVRLLSIDYSIS